MVKLNITKEKVGNVARTACGIAVFGLVTALQFLDMKDVVNTLRYNGNVTYSDAVGVIMDSGMLSSDKGRVMSELKKNKDSDYYKAIIQVVESGLLSSDKIRAIQSINEEDV